VPERPESIHRFICDLFRRLFETSYLADHLARRTVHRLAGTLTPDRRHRTRPLDATGPSLLAGLWIGTTIVVACNPILGLRELTEQLVTVFLDAGNTRIVFFCLLVGGLIALVQGSGGVEGFVGWVRSRGVGQTRRSAELLAWVVGMVVFVESRITYLTVVAVSRPLFDQMRIPQEKLAYYCDATSAPVCMAIPLNGWGACPGEFLGTSRLHCLIHPLYHRCRLPVITSIT
jgi:hypothetical protein